MAVLKHFPYFFYQYSKGILPTFAGRLNYHDVGLLELFFINVFFF